MCGEEYKDEYAVIFQMFQRQGNTRMDREQFCGDHLHPGMKPIFSEDIRVQGRGKLLLRKNSRKF